MVSRKRPRRHAPEIDIPYPFTCSFRSGIVVFGNESSDGPENRCRVNMSVGVLVAIKQDEVRAQRAWYRHTELGTEGDIRARLSQQVRLSSYDGSAAAYIETAVCGAPSFQALHGNQEYLGMRLDHGMHYR